MRTCFSSVTLAVFVSTCVLSWIALARSYIVADEFEVAHVASTTKTTMDRVRLAHGDLAWRHLAVDTNWFSGNIQPIKQGRRIVGHSQSTGTMLWYDEYNLPSFHGFDKFGIVHGTFKVGGMNVSISSISLWYPVSVLTLLITYCVARGSWGGQAVGNLARTSKSETDKGETEKGRNRAAASS